MPVRSWIVLCLVLRGGALAAAAPPPAAPPTSLPFRPAGVPGRSQAASQEARRHFQQAVALHGEGNVSGALAEFRAAYELWASAGAHVDALTALFNVGGLERDLHRYTDAIATLRKFSEGAQDVPGASKSQLAELKQMRADAQQLVREMTALLAPITFAVTPAAASVLIDGRSAAITAGTPIELPAGAHVVEVSADGHAPARREVSVVAGRAQRVDIALVPLVRTGTVVVASSRPDTRISIDGKDLGLAPVRLELPAGGHRLEATSAGFLTHRSELALAPGQSREVLVVLEPPPPPPAAAEVPVYKRWWFWGALGAVAAGGVTTALFMKGRTQGPLCVGTLSPECSPVD